MNGHRAVRNHGRTDRYRRRCFRTLSRLAAHHLSSAASVQTKPMPTCFRCPAQQMVPIAVQDECFAGGRTSRPARGPGP